jgi:hypothetical protein
MRDSLLVAGVIFLNGLLSFYRQRKQEKINEAVLDQLRLIRHENLSDVESRRLWYAAEMLALNKVTTRSDDFFEED